MQLLYKIASPVPARNETARLRTAITAVFAMDGFVFASWAVRIPAVKAAVGASPAGLGIALLGVSVGAIATMSLTGALCRRFGSARLVAIGGVWLSLALLLPALARSAVTLGLALLVLGIGYGGLNVAMNSLAVDIVAVLRRPIMPSFHAAWSLGGLAGAALGGLAAPVLSPLAHFSLVCLLCLTVFTVCGRVAATTQLPVPRAESSEGPGPGDSQGQGGGPGTGEARPIEGTPNGGASHLDAPTAHSEAGHPEAGHPGAGHSGAWRTVLLLGVIGLCSSYGEGAVTDWGALHLREDLGAAAGLAASGYAAFALAEACGRLAGSTLLARLGQTRVLVYGGLVTCAGMIATALSPVLPLALAGFALAGLGVANAFPTAMARAGILAGPNGVATASTLGYAGFLLGPPVIGFLATGLSLRAALTTVSLLAIIAVALARAASTASGTRETR